MIRSLFLTIMFSVSYFANAEMVHTQQYRFKEFHDPGWMILTDWKGSEVTASFKYLLIEFKDINSWKSDEPITVVLDDEQGIQLQRNATGQKYMVIFDGEVDPIVERLNECMSAEHVDTYTYAECHEEAGKYYEKTAARLHDFLTTNVTKELADALAVEQQSWELYQETRNAAIREYQADSFGTKDIVTNAIDYYVQMKNRFDSLVRFLE